MMFLKIENSFFLFPEDTIIIHNMACGVTPANSAEMYYLSSNKTIFALWLERGRVFKMIYRIYYLVGLLRPIILNEAWCFIHCYTL